MKARISGHEEIVTMLKEAGADIQHLEGVEVSIVCTKLIL